MSDSQRQDGAAGPSNGPAPNSYVVTRGSPPREHQFKPGVSGNPRGRPRGSKDFRTLMQRELDRIISATANGRTTQVSKREAIAMRLVASALNGDLKAIEACLKYSGEADARQDVLPPMDTDPQRERELMAAFLRREGQGQGQAEGQEQGGEA